MKVLAVDIGNTLVKTGLFDDDILQETSQFLRSSDAAPNGLNEYLTKSQINKIVVCSVLETNTNRMEMFKLYAKTFLINHQSKLPFTNTYKTPQTLGMDRVAGIAGALHFFSNTHCLVIDAGTCITYDFVSKEGIYQGGSISPGLHMRLKAMHEFTGKLPLLTYQEIEDWIGKDTQTSMLTGAIWGMVNEINGFIARYNEAFGELKVIITGGDAPKFVKHLKNNVFAEPNLLLFGLNKILKINV
ncbi:MAG: type III pantothenate kinase [Bacteroidetes bacterium]|nr:type III pantothenate kinase [Bacteroidota bacterium]